MKHTWQLTLSRLHPLRTSRRRAAEDVLAGLPEVPSRDVLELLEKDTARWHVLHPEEVAALVVHALSPTRDEVGEDTPRAWRAVRGAHALHGNSVLTDVPTPELVTQLGTHWTERHLSGCCSESTEVVHVLALERFEGSVGELLTAASALTHRT